MTILAQPFNDLLITEDRTILETMAALNNNGREVVLVKDRDGRVTGLITDGDIRRGLVAGLPLDAKAAEVMKRDFVTASPDMDRAAVLDVMRSRAFQHLPVLDSDRRLTAVHFLRDLIGATPKPNMAVIMAGGRGTRLRPITDNLPKPMVEVAGRPVLERIILHLVGHGVCDINLAVNYMAEVIEGHFGDGSAFGCRITYLREQQTLGTGGALSLLERPPEHPFFVLNADQVMRVDLTAMLESHLRGGCVATLAAGPHQVQVPFATITECDGRLVALEEKPTLDFLVNRGIYLFDPSVLQRVPPNTDFPITALFEGLINDQQPVGIFRFDDYWLDVGRPADLRQANGAGAPSPFAT